MSIVERIILIREIKELMMFHNENRTLDHDTLILLETALQKMLSALAK